MFSWKNIWWNVVTRRFFAKIIKQPDSKDMDFWLSLYNVRVVPERENKTVSNTLSTYTEKEQKTHCSKCNCDTEVKCIRIVINFTGDISGTWQKVCWDTKIYFSCQDDRQSEFGKLDKDLDSDRCQEVKSYRNVILKLEGGCDQKKKTTQDMLKNLHAPGGIVQVEGQKGVQKVFGMVVTWKYDKQLLTRVKFTEI